MTTQKCFTRKLPWILAGLIVLCGLSLDHSLAEPPATEELEALRAEIQALKDGQAQIRQELQEIKALLRAARGAPQEIPTGLVLNVKGNPFKGAATAPLTVIEFSDYQCPFCARHFRETLPQIEREYIATGKVKYVFYDFPLSSIHKQAFKAAEAANCAGEQGKYWEMHDKLFANQKALDGKGLKGHALALGLELSSFQRCLDSGSQAAEIRNDIAEGQRAGVRGTPAFLIGQTDPETSQVKVRAVMRGAKAYANFREVLEGLLTAKPE
jgi:protein-disulfide isomerase